jgi:hypothetical protein
LVGRAEKKKTLGRQRHRRYGGIEVDLIEIRHNIMHWTEVDHDRNQQRNPVEKEIYIKVP